VPHAVDLDVDGVAELLFQNCVYSAIDCSIKWCRLSPTISGATTAVANLLPSTPESEVVLVVRGTVAAYLFDGTPLWSTSTDLAGGGLPTIADYNGDGVPDVGVSDQDFYYMLNGLDGTLLRPIFIVGEDSSVTGIIRSSKFLSDGKPVDTRNAHRVCFV